MPRGEAISRRFQERGATEGLPSARHNGIAVFEVFPAPALVRLFGLETALTYKKKRHPTWDTCRAGLSSYINQLRQLTSPALTFNTPLVVNGEKGKALKHIEDQADAVMCAYLAALACLYGEERLEMIGTLEEGYVVVPQPANLA